MKTFAMAACLAAACASAARADVSRSEFTYSPVTIVCNVLEVDPAMGTYGGGVIYVNFNGKPLLNASPGYGISFDKRRCKRIRTATLPKPVVPRPSFAMSQGEDYECPVSRPVVIHAHFLKRAGRLDALYMSVRLRRTGSWVVAGLVNLRGHGREYLGPTCKSR
jgi:hypothetical protein